jgi:hypothetical protein
VTACGWTAEVPPDPFEDALAELERDRRDRVVAGAVVTLASVATLVIVLAATGVATWPAATGVSAVALVAVVGAHVASVVVRERRSVRATRALVAARSAHAAEEARERALGALHAAARSVAASLDLAEVVDRGVAASRAVSGAGSAVLLLRAGDELAVAAAAGPGAPPRGTRRCVTRADRLVLEGGESVAGGRGSDWGDGPATVTAPLALPDRVVGTLVVRRSAADRAFAEHERLAVALLAEHVALAVRNATEHDRERQRAEAFRDLVGLPPEARDDGAPPDVRR